MNALVVYDSTYGNTGKVAQAITTAMSKFANVKLLAIKDATVAELNNIDTLVIGSPTQGGRPTQPIQDFIKELDETILGKMHVAAFDTRFAKEDHGFGLRALMGIIGFAAPKITNSLEAKGAQVAAEPLGIIVADKAGPLKNGETQRAQDWALGLKA